MDKDRFICPRCGKELFIADAEILEQRKSFKIGMPRLVGRKIVSTDTVDYDYVRFCPKCAKKIKFYDKWYILIALFITELIFFATTPFWFGKWELGDALIMCLYAAPVLLFPASIITIPLLEIFCKINVNWEKAKEGNAYPVSWLERRNNKQNKKAT